MSGGAEDPVSEFFAGLSRVAESEEFITTAARRPAGVEDLRVLAVAFGGAALSALHRRDDRRMEIVGLVREVLRTVDDYPHERPRSAVGDTSIALMDTAMSRGAGRDLARSLPLAVVSVVFSYHETLADVADVGITMSGEKVMRDLGERVRSVMRRVERAYGWDDTPSEGGAS